jgi:ABC-type sugar transport system ATPase subunit
VIHVELMGSEIFAHVEVGGPESKITLVVRLPGDQPVGVGDTLPLGVDTQKLHVFDASGVNLTLDPHPAPIGHSTRG